MPNQNKQTKPSVQKEGGNLFAELGEILDNPTQDKKGGISQQKTTTMSLEAEQLISKFAIDVLKVDPSPYNKVMRRLVSAGAFALAIKEGQSTTQAKAISKTLFENYIPKKK